MRSSAARTTGAGSLDGSNGGGTCAPTTTGSGAATAVAGTPAVPGTPAVAGTPAIGSGTATAGAVTRSGAAVRAPTLRPSSLPVSASASNGGTADAIRAGIHDAATPATSATRAMATTVATGIENTPSPNEARAHTANAAAPVPAAIPNSVPTEENDTPSSNTIRSTARREAPATLRRPNSRRRSPTDRTRVLTTPTRACRSVNSSIHSTTRSKPRSTSPRSPTNSWGVVTAVTPYEVASSLTRAAVASVPSVFTSAARSVVAGTWRVSTARSVTTSPSTGPPLS